MIVSFSTFISVQWKWTFRSLRSFPFSGNERFVLYVHFRSVEMNVSFSTFSSVQWKWTFCSIRSFPFIKNERKWTFRSFQLGRAQKSPKMTKKKGLFGVKSGSKMAKNSKMNGNERKKWTTRSFLFNTTEQFVHCVHFRSVQMNISFTAFISVQ